MTLLVFFRMWITKWSISIMTTSNYSNNIYVKILISLLLFFEVIFTIFLYNGNLAIHHAAEVWLPGILSSLLSRSLNHCLSEFLVNICKCHWNLSCLFLILRLNEWFINVGWGIWRRNAKNVYWFDICLKIFVVFFRKEDLHWLMPKCQITMAFLLRILLLFLIFG